MDFSPSDKTREYASRLQAFMDNEILPAESIYHRQRHELAQAGAPHGRPAVIEELKVKAKALGLWNLFLPHYGHGLSVSDYATLAEITGWSPEIAPEVINCAAPDTGNMELLDMFGSAEQKSQWLEPLLDGRIRSGFAMTEPDVASSDARNIKTSMIKDGDHYIINGRKWWTTGALDSRCEILIVMGKSDPDADDHRQQSMILVPINTPGVKVIRNLTVFGYVDQHGHAEITFTDVRVPASNLLGAQGEGFALAQARLDPSLYACDRNGRARALTYDPKIIGTKPLWKRVGSAGSCSAVDSPRAHRHRTGTPTGLKGGVDDRYGGCKGCPQRDCSDQGCSTCHGRAHHR